MNLIKYVSSKKYRFFQKKVTDVQYSMWDLDFKISKARHMREESRMMRDRAMEVLQGLKANPKPDEAKIAEMESHVKGYEAQMSLIDSQIQGTPANEEETAQTGLVDAVAGLANLRELYKDYLKQI